MTFESDMKQIKKMKNTLKFTIIAAEKSEGEKLFNYSLIKVFAKDEKEAMTKAKKCLKRKVYKVKEVEELINNSYSEEKNLLASVGKQNNLAMRILKAAKIKI